MLRRLLALTLIAGCGDSAAVQPDAAATGDAVDAAKPHQIVVHAPVRPIVNDGAGLPVAGPEVPYRMSMIAQRGSDRVDVMLPVGAAGDFGFVTSDDKYRVSMALDSTIPVEYQMRAPQLELAGRFVGRYDRAAVGAGTTLEVTVTNASGAGFGGIATTGVWTQTQRPSNTSNGSFTLDWTQAGSLGGPVGLVDAAQNDRAYYGVIEGVGSPQYNAITSFCSANLTMTSGATNTFACTAATLAQSTCMHVAVPFADETARMTAVTGSLYPNYFNTWLAQATAQPSTGVSGSLYLAYQNPAASTTAPANLDQDFTFGNPYPGTDIVLVMNTGKSRSFALPGTGTTTISATVNVYVMAQADCTTATAPPANLIAIPSLPRIDGVHLDSDAITIGLADRMHTVAWDLGSPGAVDYWVVRVYRAAINTSNNTRLGPVHVYVTLDREVMLDPADFTKGDTYFVEVQAVTGVPNAATGDFRTISYPYATSSVFSAAFRLIE